VDSFLFLISSSTGAAAAAADYEEKGTKKKMYQVAVNFSDTGALIFARWALKLFQ
jgi:hypothetical protein